MFRDSYILLVVLSMNSNNLKQSIEKLSDEELANKINSILHILSSKYNLEPSKILEIVPKLDHIPVSIFSAELSPLESLVVYLHDYLQMDFIDIASKLKRHYQTIWRTYYLAKRKTKELKLDKESIFVPIEVFQTRKTTIFESLVLHLKKEHNLSNSKISGFLNRDYRTIWTIANRAERKLNAKT